MIVALVQNFVDIIIQIGRSPSYGEILLVTRK